MEGSLISYEIGDPRVPKILENWGPGSLSLYKNGDPGSPFWGAPFSLNTGIKSYLVRLFGIPFFRYFVVSSIGFIKFTRFETVMSSH